MLRAAEHDYDRAHGISRSCGTVAGHNLPSLRALEGRIRGTIKLRLFLGGLYTRVTPWEEVLRMLNTRWPDDYHPAE